ncbi:MAG: hypothetical protein DWQ02_06685 [Bacteroidetes bacterium]|nr:MAG: hypothetical protein DWQ02_06685 [Bacteroidota bacterium]
MTDNQSSNTLENLILFEMKGKSHAIEIYDRILWIIRTGYFTLFFGGWALILQGFFDKDTSFENIKSILIGFCILSIFISIGGYLTDINYLKGKFRVINDLDKLIKWTLINKATVSENEQLKEEDLKLLKNLLTNSGDSGTREYLTPGYKTAKKSILLLYAGSIISILLVVLLLRQIY